MSECRFWGMTRLCNDLRRAAVVVTGVICFGASALSVTACSCAPEPPPCVAYGESPMIFLGTVTQIPQLRLAQMRIDRAYKGVTAKTVVLWDSGMCDGPSLKVGEQYPMYTYDDGSGYIPSRGCIRSRNVKDAEEDIKFLNGLEKTPPTGTVFGEVTMRTGGIASQGEPAPAVAVAIIGDGEKSASATDSTGHYSFSGLKPGSYSLKVTRAGFHQSDSESDATAEVEARTCTVADLVLRRNSQANIHGRLMRLDGTPAPAGVPVDLVRVSGAEQERTGGLLIGFTAHTNDRGEYTFPGIAPGLYKVVLNIYKVPTAEDPYPTIYWPDVRTEEAASAVEIPDMESSAQCDFRLPAELRSTPVSFIVLLPDGTPAKGVKVNIASLNGVAAWAGHAITDAWGRFSFGAIEGFEYTARDIFTNEGLLATPVGFSAADGSQPVTLHLVPRER